jgi:hypothetical protein
MVSALGVRSGVVITGLLFLLPTRIGQEESYDLHAALNAGTGDGNNVLQLFASLAFGIH